MLFLTRPASPSSQVRWKCLFEVLLLTFPPGCKLQLLLDYTDSGSEKETWQMMCGTMPTFKARPATFPDVIFFTLHPPQQWGAKREERGEKTASQTEQKACSSKEKKKSHTPARNIKCSAHVALIHKQKGIFLSSRRMFFFPSRWCVIIYILPKMRICGCCCIYTNSDLQGGYRWQILRLCGRLDKSLEEWSQLI